MMQPPAIYLPHPVLRPFIEIYIHLEMNTLVHDVIPTGASQIFFVLNENTMTYREATGERVGKRFFFSNPGSSYCNIQSVEYWRSIGIIFKPFGAYRLLGIPQDLLSGEFPEMETIMPASIKQVQTQLEDNIESIPKLIQILNNWLLSLFYKMKDFDLRRMIRASEMIQKSIGLQSIKTLCNELYISKRTLELDFKEIIGMSPKMYSRIIRFNKVQDLISKTNKVDFQKICLDFNYYDQAHLIKEFKQFSGFTPAKYSLRNGDMGSSFK